MRSLVGLFLPLFCIVDLETNNGLMSAAGELLMLNRLLIVPRVEHADHWGRFVLGRAETQRVDGNTRQSHNECTSNALNHSTCSHKWCD